MSQDNRRNKILVLKDVLFASTTTCKSSSHIQLWQRGIKKTNYVMQDGERSDRPVLQLRWRLNQKAKLRGIKSFINMLEEVEILICKLFFLFYVKLDCLEFCMNVKDFGYYLWHVKRLNIFT